MKTIKMSLSDFEITNALSDAVSDVGEATESFLYSGKFWFGLIAIGAAIGLGIYLYKYYSGKNLKRDQMMHQGMLQDEENNRATQMQEGYYN